MKCDNCVYGKMTYGIIGNAYESDINFEGLKCNHPDNDVADVNNEVLEQGKTIYECCEYKEKADNCHKAESMLAKAEELKQEGLI